MSAPIADRIAKAVDALLSELPLSDDGTGHVADCGWNDETLGGSACETLRPRLAAVLAPLVEEAAREAVDAERERWVAQLSPLCDDEWLRRRDRAMELPGAQSHRWERRAASAWERAAHDVRGVLNALARYDDEYVDRHASLLAWMKRGRDEGEARRREEADGG